MSQQFLLSRFVDQPKLDHEHDQQLQDLTPFTSPPPGHSVFCVSKCPLWMLAHLSFTVAYGGHHTFMHFLWSSFLKEQDIDNALDCAINDLKEISKYVQNP